MDILGIGGWELVVIFIIMLVVAGPQRMIRWSYVMGQWVGKLRNLWREMATQLQKEIDAAGVDIKVPTQPVTRASMQRDMLNSLNKAAKPLKDPLNAVKTEVDNAARGVTPAAAAKPATSAFAPPEKPAEEAPQAAETSGSSKFGAWASSGQSQPE